MGYSCDFLDNIAYDAGSINAIRAAVLNKGVVPDSLDSCKVECDGDIIIKSGQAVFSDGCRISIDDEVVLEKIQDKTNYVFFQRNKQLNNPRPVVSDTPPASEDIPLAEVEADDTITDKRNFTSLKIPSMQGNHSIALDIPTIRAEGEKGEWAIMAYADLDYYGYTHALLGSYSYYGYPSEYIIYYGIQNLKDQTAISFHDTNYKGNDIRTGEYSSVYCKIVLTANRLNIYVTDKTKDFDFSSETYFYIKLM